MNNKNIVTVVGNQKYAEMCIQETLRLLKKAELTKVIEEGKSIVYWYDRKSRKGHVSTTYRNYREDNSVWRARVDFDISADKVTENDLNEIKDYLNTVHEDMSRYSGNMVEGTVFELVENGETITYIVLYDKELQSLTVSDMARTQGNYEHETLLTDYWVKRHIKDNESFLVNINGSEYSFETIHEYGPRNSSYHGYFGNDNNTKEYEGIISDNHRVKYMFTKKTKSTK